MSLLDMKSACNLDFKCIGAIDNSINSIKCFTKKNVPYPEGCSIEIENIILSTEDMTRETGILMKERSMLNTLKDDHNIYTNKYKELNTELEIKIRRHNENVSYLIKRKNMIKDTYFKEIIVQ